MLIPLLILEPASLGFYVDCESAVLQEPSRPEAADGSDEASSLISWEISGFPVSMVWGSKLDYFDHIAYADLRFLLVLFL